MSNGSCSHQICVFTRRPTWARSPTAVISAPISSPTTLCCMLTRGPTPKRSLSAVSTVKSIQPQWEPQWSHSGLEPYMCPECHLPSIPGVSQIPPGNPFRTTGPGICPQVQVLSAPRRKFTMICHFYNTKDG